MVCPLAVGERTRNPGSRKRLFWYRISGRCRERRAVPVFEESFKPFVESPSISELVGQVVVKRAYDIRAWLQQSMCHDRTPTSSWAGGGEFTRPSEVDVLSLFLRRFRDHVPSPMRVPGPPAWQHCNLDQIETTAWRARRTTIPFSVFSQLVTSWAEGRPGV